MPRRTAQETRTEGLTPKDTAERLGLTTRSLLNFEKRGLPVVGEGHAKRYPWPAARDWYNEYLQEQATPDDDELAEARARKWSASARRAEFELARVEGSMVTVEDMGRLLEDVLQRLRGKLLSLPAKLAPRMVGLDSRAQALPILEAEVAEIMAELHLDAAEDSPLAA